MRRATAVAAVILLVALTLPARAQRIRDASTESMAALARGEWPTYAGTYAVRKLPPRVSV